MNRRTNLARAMVLAAGAGLSPAAIACGAGQAAAPSATATSEPAPRTQAFNSQVQVVPQEARLGQDENVVLRVLFRNSQGRPVSGAVLTAMVNYPGGARTFTSEVSTFPDGRTELAIPVAPEGSRVARGTNVRIEAIMKYQGQEYRSNAGFNVR